MRSNRGHFKQTWSSSPRGLPLRSGVQVFLNAPVFGAQWMKSARCRPPVTLCSLRSQASESGSADDTQSQVLEWQEMVAEAVSARDRAKEEKTAMALRISHMEEEREGKAASRG